MREQKNKEYNERKAAKQAEWDEYKKLLEAEEAKRDPWEEEKVNPNPNPNLTLTLT